MDFHNQPDGFFEEHRGRSQCHHPECSILDECCLPLGPNENSGKGRREVNPEPDVWSLTHNRSQFRLAKGFNMLLRSER
jgi:hypothetical protein